MSDDRVVCSKCGCRCVGDPEPGPPCSCKKPGPWITLREWYLRRRLEEGEKKFPAAYKELRVTDRLWSILRELAPTEADRDKLNILPLNMREVEKARMVISLLYDGIHYGNWPWRKK